jgi:RimJ/RimL family protein N-acetyltransferase
MARSEKRVKEIMYKCLKKNNLRDMIGYQLIAIRQEDIELIRLWRNAQIEVLRQKVEISPQEQQHYFQKNVWPTFLEQNPKQILFSFLLQQDCIGYGGLTYLDWESKRAEISFLVNPIRAADWTLYTRDFRHFLTLLFQVAFEDLHLHRLLTETFAFRWETLEILEEFGFKQEGILREHVFKGNQWHESIIHGLLASEYSPGKCIEHPAVLITSISKKMPLIEAVRHAANKLGKFKDIHGCDQHHFCIGQYGVDKFWHCPPLDQMTAEKVISYCHENRILAIIPTRDADLEFYARHLSFFHQQGIYPMVSSLETIENCLDKKKFADFLLNAQLPAIPTSLSLDDLHSSAYVVKERRGAGSQQLSLHLTRQEAFAHSQQLKEPVFQPYIEGIEWSVDVYRSFEGRVKACVARQRNDVVNGESQVTTTFHYPALEQLCQDMAEKLKIQGPANFQVIENVNGSFHVIECNPRFGGASTASIAVGLDSFFWFFVECLGLSLQDYPFRRRKGDIRQIRYMTDKVLPWSSYLI